MYTCMNTIHNISASHWIISFSPNKHLSYRTLLVGQSIFILHIFVVVAIQERGGDEWMACDDNKNKHTQMCLRCLYASKCVVEPTNHRQSLLQLLNRQLEFDRLSVLFTLIYSLWWCVRVTNRVQSSWWSNTYLSLLLLSFFEWVSEWLWPNASIIHPAICIICSVLAI